jgi:hypothetical protein
MYTELQNLWTFSLYLYDWKQHCRYAMYPPCWRQTTSIMYMMEFMYKWIFSGGGGALALCALEYFHKQVEMYYLAQPIMSTISTFTPPPSR